MKTQIKFQKILALVTLIIAAIAFVFALSFFTGNLSDIMSYRLAGMQENYSGRFQYNGESHVIREARPADYISGINDWILLAQSTLSTIITLCIVYFVIIACLYIFSMNSRRKYYVTNYIMSGVIIAYSAFLAIFGIVSMIILMTGFFGLTFDYPGDVTFAFLKERCQLSDVSSSPLMFILGFVAFALVLLIALAWAYNLIWKIKLMKGEKELLSKGFVKEVA